MIRVLLTQRFSEAQIDLLRAVSPTLQIIQKSVREEWDRMATDDFFEGDEEILYCFMPPRDLARAPRLKWVQLHSAGINHLTGHPILSSPIAITTSSGIHAVPIGEYCIATMLALARRVPRMVQFQAGAEWPSDRWDLFMGTELRGKTLGVIGYGSIGREVARMAKNAFAMRVLAMTRNGEKLDHGYSEPGVGDPEGKWPDAWFQRDHLADLLAQSDFVLLSAPLTEETRHMIGSAELRTMKPTAYIINIARGELIDESALVHALQEGWIGGAGLDVFTHEPLSPDSELWKLENVILSPHIAATTPHYDHRAVALFSENLQRYLRGDTLLNLVTPGKGY